VLKYIQNRKISAKRIELANGQAKNWTGPHLPIKNEPVQTGSDRFGSFGPITNPKKNRILEINTENF
jgi:hypothetical protein